MQSISVFRDIAKTAVFWQNNADISRNKSVSRYRYIFWIFFRQGITVPSFIIVGDWQILGGEVFCPPPPSFHPWAAPKMAILYRLNTTVTAFWKCLLCFDWWDLLMLFCFCFYFHIWSKMLTISFMAFIMQ